MYRFLKAAILYYAMKIASLAGGAGGVIVTGSENDILNQNTKKKRNNAELINGLLGMNLSQLDLAGKK